MNQLGPKFIHNKQSAFLYLYEIFSLIAQAIIDFWSIEEAYSEMVSICYVLIHMVSWWGG